MVRAPVPDTSREATFCFVDLSGFTALTEAHGDAGAAELAMRFADLARQSLSSGDKLVKTLGDAVLVACGGPGPALTFLMELFRRADTQPDFPLLRAGLHHGTAVEKEGDFFGAAVNLAARIASLAHAGQVLATAPVAHIARQRQMEVVDLGSFELRNVRQQVRVYALVTGEVSRGGAIDPVCQIRVGRDRAIGRLRHSGVEYWFCSLACAGAFANDPGRFMREKSRG